MFDDQKKKEKACFKQFKKDLIYDVISLRDVLESINRNASQPPASLCNRAHLLYISPHINPVKLTTQN